MAGWWSAVEMNRNLSLREGLKKRMQKKWMGRHPFRCFYILNARKRLCFCEDFFQKFLFSVLLRQFFLICGSELRKLSTRQRKSLLWAMLSTIVIMLPNKHVFSMWQAD